MRRTGIRDTHSTKRNDMNTKLTNVIGALRAEIATLKEVAPYDTDGRARRYALEPVLEALTTRGGSDEHNRAVHKIEANYRAEQLKGWTPPVV